MNLMHFLDEKGIPYRVYQHDETFDAQHMAQSLHVSGRRIAKAVMVRVNEGAKYVVLLLPAPMLVCLQRVSKALGGAKVELATEAEMLKHAPGCEFGVVPVFGSQFGMETIVDQSLTTQDEIVFQGDTHEESIRLRFHDFYTLEHPRIASIAEPQATAESAS